MKIRNEAPVFRGKFKRTGVPESEENYEKKNI